MIWNDLSDEEREDWRKAPATIAFVELLKDSEEAALHSLLAATNRDEASRHEIARLAGKRDGIEAALDLLENA